MIQENYTPGHSLNASQFMAKRRASSHAAFFLPYLKPGMKTLDCGCGPGTITVGLAEAVAPAPAIGVDFAGSQVALARTAAEQCGIGNVQFKVGNAYNLPFDEGEFDAIFSQSGEAARLGEEDTARIGAMARVLRAWSEHPDALFAQAWLAAVGWRE